MPVFYTSLYPKHETEISITEIPISVCLISFFRFFTFFPLFPLYSFLHHIYSLLSFFLRTANISGLHPIMQRYTTPRRIRTKIQYSILPYLNDDSLVTSLPSHTSVIFFCCTFSPKFSTIQCKNISWDPFVRLLCMRYRQV